HFDELRGRIATVAGDHLIDDGEMKQGAGRADQTQQRGGNSGNPKRSTHDGPPAIRNCAPSINACRVKSIPIKAQNRWSAVCGGELPAAIRGGAIVFRRSYLAGLRMGLFSRDTSDEIREMQRGGPAAQKSGPRLPWTPLAIRATALQSRGDVSASRP